MVAESVLITLGVGFACIGIATAILGGVTVRISDPTYRGLALARVLGVPCQGACIRDRRPEPSGLVHAISARGPNFLLKP